VAGARPGAGSGFGQFLLPVLTAVEGAQEDHRLVRDQKQQGHAALEADDAQILADIVAPGSALGGEFEFTSVGFDPLDVSQGQRRTRFEFDPTIDVDEVAA
jgi:hypothetical protein